MQRITHICFILVLAISVIPFAQSPAVGEETKTIWVAHHRVDCIGVAPQKCYLIKDTQYEDWRFWYGEIEGFEFEDGYAYELRVVEREIENPPADASSRRLELLEVILKVETFETPDPEPSPPPAVPIDVAPARPEPMEPAPAPMPTPAPTPAPTPPQVESEAMTPETTPPAAPVLPTPAPVAPSADAGRVFRGHLTIGAGVEARSFKLCGAEEGIWVEDRTDADLWGLYRRLSSYPNRPLYMEVTGELKEAPQGGFGSHFQQQILITGVRNASAESAGCFAEPDPFAFRASGNEPFWNVVISKRGLAFSELGQEGKILFPYSTPTFFGEQIIYRSQIRGQVPRTLVVRLEEQPCSDSMADATFGFTAKVKIDDRELDGCAREGEEEP